VKKAGRFPAREKASASEVFTLCSMLEVIMRICDVLAALKEMLMHSEGDQKYAYSVYATALYLIGWLKKVSVVEDIGDIREKLTSVHCGFLYHCNLLDREDAIQEDPMAGPHFFACRALTILMDGSMVCYDKRKWEKFISDSSLEDIGDIRA
jgi:hypothetical protein